MSEKITLIIPNAKWHGKRAWTIINHGSLIISSIMKDVFDFTILDANGQNLSKDECYNFLKEQQPKIVMIATVSFEYHKENHLAAEIAKKSCNAITIMGGVYVTTMTESVMRDTNIDYGFIGHAEERLVNFIDLLLSNDTEAIMSFPGLAYRDNNDLRINMLKTTIMDIKKLVDPDYSKIDASPYCDFDAKKEFQFSFHGKRVATIITSFGCPYNCVFCSTRTITGKNIRYRTSDSVINEIRYLVTNYNIECFTFVDDCLMFNRERIKEILINIIENRFNINFKILNVALWHLDEELVSLLKEAGCVQMTISVESGSLRVLREIIRKPLDKEMAKKAVSICKEAGIDITTSWIIGFPGETWEEIRETFAFADELDSDYAAFHIATVLPKTDLYYQTKELGLLPEDFSFTDENFFGFAESFIETEEFNPFELKVLRAFEWDRINFSRPDKTEKIAEMFNITLDELSYHRQQTRRKLGIHL